MNILKVYGRFMVEPYCWPPETIARLTDTQVYLYAKAGQWANEMSKPANERSLEFSDADQQEWPPPKGQYIASGMHDQGWTREKAEEMYAEIVREYEASQNKGQEHA